MKAVERKHLETNSLVEGVETLSHTLNKGLPRRYWGALGLILLAVGLYYAWQYFSARSQSANSALWWKWDQVGNGDGLTSAYSSLSTDDKQSPTFIEKLESQQLEEFIKGNKGTIQGRLAKFQLARLNLFEGLRDLGIAMKPQKENSLACLKKAAELYKELIADSKGDPILLPEAILNSGKANEALGNLTDAKTYYTRLKNDFAQSRFGKIGEKELKRLESDGSIVGELSKELTTVPSSSN